MANAESPSRAGLTICKKNQGACGAFWFELSGTSVQERRDGARVSNLEEDRQIQTRLPDLAHVILLTTEGQSG